MKILVFGGWFGSRNVGDEAILLGLAKLLRETFPGCEVSAHSIDPDYTGRVCGVRPVATRPASSFAAKAVLLAREYRSCDLFVVSGGTPIFDYYLLSRLFHFGVPLLSGVPMVFVGVGTKRIVSRRGMRFYRHVLQRARYVSIREPEVGEHLRAIGVRRELRLTADSAVCMEPRPREAAEALLESAGIDLERPVVAVCPILLSDNYRDHYHEPVPPDVRLRTHQAVARVAEQQTGLGRQVVFVAMHQQAPDDDREVIQRIREACRARTFCPDPPEDPPLVAALLGRADMVIGMRLHSLVLASARGTPSVGIGFDMKVGGFMRYLGLGDYHIPIRAVDDRALGSVVEQCWENRKLLRQDITSRVAEWRELVAASIHEVRAALARPDTRN